MEPCGAPAAHMRHALPLMLLLGLAAVGTAAGAPAKTTLTYTTDAAKLVDIWVDKEYFEVLGGDKKPKFTGSAISSGIIRWAKNDDHHMKSSPVAAVLTTGDAKRAISKEPYTGESKPTYPDIVDSHIKDSHDAVVLDFWVRAKTSEGGIIGSVHAATNEGSPAAIKIHGAGRPRDMFHVEIDGKIQDKKSFERIWDSSIECEDSCKPPKPGLKMQYVAEGKYYQETGLPKMKKGKAYHIKVRIADTGDRLVDSALYLNQNKLIAWG